MSIPQPIPFKPEGPQPLTRDTPKGAAYPVYALGALKAAVEGVADISQAPIAIAAQSALSVAALAVQGFADVETLGSYAPCSLFCLTIAESGERKSTCDKLLIGGVREYEKEQDVKYQSDLAEYNISNSIWSAKQKRLITEAARADKNKAIEAEADLRAMGQEPRPPIAPNLTAMDPTFEGLLKLYGIGRPALGLFSDEAGGFIGGHAMNSDNKLKTMAGLSKLWDGEPVDRTRAGDGATTYRGRRLSAHLMVQPVAALPLLADREASGQGFLARFLLTQPPSNIGTRLKQSQNSSSRLDVDAFGLQLRRTLAADLPTGDSPQELTPTRLVLSDDAKQLLIKFYDAVEQSQGAGQEMERCRSFASKAAEQAARIAGVLTLWENTEASDVSIDAMKNGIALADYYLSEAKRLSDAGGISIETASAEALRKWLIDSWGHPEITPSEVVQYGPSALRDSKKAKPALAMLLAHGWIEALPQGATVRGATRKEAFLVVRACSAV